MLFGRQWLASLKESNMIIKLIAGLKLTNKKWWSVTSASKEFNFRWDRALGVHVKAVANHIKRNHDNN